MAQNLVHQAWQLHNQHYWYHQVKALVPKLSTFINFLFQFVNKHKSKHSHHRIQYLQFRRWSYLHHNHQGDLHLSLNFACRSPYFHHLHFHLKGNLQHQYQFHLHHREFRICPNNSIKSLKLSRLLQYSQILEIVSETLGSFHGLFLKFFICIFKFKCREIAISEDKHFHRLKPFLQYWVHVWVCYSF